MNSKQTNDQSMSFEQITAKAREFWQKAGSPEGRDLEFWLAAEHELQREKEDVRETKRGKGKSPRSTPSGGELSSETFEAEIPTTAGHSGRSPTSL
jgi:hypothetical protein